MQLGLHLECLTFSLKYCIFIPIVIIMNFVHFWDEMLIGLGYYLNARIYSIRHCICLSKPVLCLIFFSLRNRQKLTHCTVLTKVEKKIMVVEFTCYSVNPRTVSVQMSICPVTWLAYSYPCQLSSCWPSLCTTYHLLRERFISGMPVQYIRNLKREIQTTIL